MAKDPAFLMYYKDVLVSCAGWDADVLGWYMRLICHQADKPEGLPNDVESLALLAGVKMSQFARFEACFKHTLKDKFEANALGNLVNTRMSQVLENRKGYSDKQALRGIVGYWIKQARKIGIVDENRLKTLSEALFEEFTIEQTKEEREACFKRTLEAFLGNANANGNTIVFENEEKGVQGEKHTEPQVTIPTVSQNQKPTLEESKSYFVQIKSTEEEGELFFHHYEAQGWKNGNGIWITNWRSQAMKWLLKGSEHQKGGVNAVAVPKNMQKPQKMGKAMTLISENEQAKKLIEEKYDGQQG
jgi:hypothetical protein